MKQTRYIFLDADAIIALNYSKHPNHKKAKNIANQNTNSNVKVVSCTYVVLEIATVLNMYFEKSLGTKIANQILFSSDFKIISGDKFLNEGIELLSKQKSKNVSLNDCVYFAIAKKFRIKEIFSFDKHWAKNGFKLL